MNSSFLFFWLSSGCTKEEKINEKEPTTDPAEELEDTTSDWPELDLFIEEKMAEGNIPGLGVAIIANGQVVLAKGYGWANIESQIPVDGDTPFMLASISKLFTGTAVMQLVEQEMLTLDDSVNDLLPYTIDNPQTEGEDIQVKHLVSHSSAIRDRYDVWGELGVPGALYTYGDSDIPLGEFMEGYLSPQGEWYRENNFLDAMPGEQYEYSNMATALAGQLVEDVSGTPLNIHSDINVFDVLGLANTGWHLDDFVNVDNIAMPYELHNGDYLAYGHYGYPDYPDGQLRASPADLARFLLAYTNGGSIDGQQILSSQTIDQMWDPVLPDLEPTQGVFWYWSEYWGRTLIGHNGSDYGVATDMYYNPATGVGIIVLANTDWRSGMTTAMDEIEQYMFELGESL